MSKILTAYFSATGVTAKAAKQLALAADSDLYEIRPLLPYTAADLDWKDASSRSSIEMKDPDSRPAIQNDPIKMENYDTIFLGFPIWWYKAPTIIQTFLEKYDFSGKTILLFATSGGSDFGKTADFLKNSVAASASIKVGKLLNGEINPDELKAWINTIPEVQ